jgi:hypothetical protein
MEKWEDLNAEFVETQRRMWSKVDLEIMTGESEGHLSAFAMRVHLIILRQVE